jgi:hypothetical protein
LFVALPDIQSMKAGEIRKELESYGISTKAFLEKKEMVEALSKARAEGKTPINKSEDVRDDVNGVGASTSAKTSASSSTSSSKSSREQRIKEEIEKAMKMKTGDLKKELKNRGISTRSFFEKSEFAKAYAEAVVDGKKKASASSSTTANKEQDEPYDPSYRDVVMQKMDARDPRLLQGRIIDVPLRR